jgi:flagellar L-ring protein precursor FlgH
MWKGLVLAMALGLIVGGCASSRTVKHEPITPETLGRPEPLGQEQFAEAGLWRGGRKIWLFRDLRAREVGDVVTVNVVETAKGSKNATTKTQRGSSIDAGIEAFLGYETWLEEHNSRFNSDNMVKARMAKGFDGSGTTTRTETMTASISARVVEVLPNDNLVIRGSRHVRLNHEDQIIVLSGIIRPEDISPDNTILSSFVADAKIEYFGKGVVSDEQRPGWLARILDAVWPF